MTDVFARIGVLLVVLALLVPRAPGNLDRYLGGGIGLALLVYGIVLAAFVVAELSDVRLLRTADRD